MYLTSSNNLVVESYGVTNPLSTPFNPTLNTWYHIAISRSGNTLKAFVNGNSIGSTTDSTSYTQQVLNIGQRPSSAYALIGYLDDFRITKAARYISNFTPPTSPLPRLVTDQKGHSLTLNGNAQISTTQNQFGGGSIAFNGTNSYLSTSNTTDWYFGNGDFTVEAWIYLNSTTGTQRIVDRT